MSYQALYRVWRPQKFHDVVGQEHITKTLQNALLQEKFSHAYLFSGPRGTGKTSAAKIIAKAVNCEKAPIAEPCNECSSCVGITDGSISDVLEIDAASNNGVAEIRDIRDKVKYAPSAVRYKVYIIDEVHMLSEGAFNALLKTLEEPPRHVIFILATTEPHKIPLTIISRCQRFDFRRVSLRPMIDRMKTIMNSQGIIAEDAALKLVAQAAEGGMRDALSILDQAISFSDEKVTAEDVLAVTGAVSQGFLGETAKALLEKDVIKALKAVDELLKQGKEPLRFIEDLIFYFRDMLLYQTAPNLEEVFERVSVDENFKDLAEKSPSTWIYEVIDQLNASQQEMKWTNHPKIYLEMALMKICQETQNAVKSQSNQEIESLLNRINSLETELKKLKEEGVAVKTSANSEPKRERRPMKTPGKGMNIPITQINDMLKNATKQELNKLKNHWAEVMELLKKEKISAHATLIDSEPVAASLDSFILSFKYEIHCKMASENHDIIERIVAEIQGHPLKMFAIPQNEWKKIKDEFIRKQRNDSNEEEKAEDPLISEAKKLFGPEIIEIKD